MENRYSLMRQGSGVWRSLRDGDFEEEDVWDVLRERKDSNSKIGKSVESSFSVPRNLPSASRMLPRATSSGSSSNHSSNETKLVQQQSAPVNIPDWSKICKRKSKKLSKNTNSRLDFDDGNDDDDDDDDEYDGDDNDSENYNGVFNGDSGDENEDEDNDFYYKLPPHELIARRLARSQISSFSVFEGVGRKLKGRDLSVVRNAVLTKTGFLESP